MDDGKYNLKAKNNGKEHVQINVQYRLILKIIKKQKQTKKTQYMQYSDERYNHRCIPIRILSFLNSIQK